jgi:hypothetical protein
MKLISANLTIFYGPSIRSNSHNYPRESKIEQKLEHVIGACRQRFGRGADLSSMTSHGFKQILV